MPLERTVAISRKISLASSETRGEDDTVSLVGTNPEDTMLRPSSFAIASLFFAGPVAVLIVPPVGRPQAKEDEKAKQPTP